MSAPAALRDAWYDRLAADGFVDLEARRNPDAPIASGPAVQTRAARPPAVVGKADYFDMARAALYSDALPAQWKRGRARKVLELHVTGLWNRRIRDQVKCGRTFVEETIRAFALWLRRERPAGRTSTQGLGRGSWRLTARLTDGETDALYWLAGQLGCTPAQAARASIRAAVSRRADIAGSDVSTHDRIGAATLSEVAIADGGSNR